MKKSELREIIQETLFEALTEALCAKGKAYVAKRKRAGEKHGAYLMGRAVKVCKGQIKGEDVDEAMYGTAIHDAPKKKIKKEDAAMKKSALGMAMYGKKSKMNEQDGQVNVFGYQTKHYDICPGAQSLYKRIVDEKLVEDKDLVVRVAKLHDSLFYLEKMAIEKKIEVTSDLVDMAQNTADLIMSAAKEKMNLEKEHSYVQGHVDKIKSLMMERARYKDGGQPLPIREKNMDVKDDTEFKIKLKHLLQKHATNLEKGKADTEFKLTLKHLLDKHVSKGGMGKND